MKKTLIESYKMWLAENDAGGSTTWKNNATSAYKKETARLGAHAKRLQAVIDHHQTEFNMSANRYPNHGFRDGDLKNMQNHKVEVARFLKMKKTVNPTDKEIKDVLDRHKEIMGK